MQKSSGYAERSGFPPIFTQRSLRKTTNTGLSCYLASGEMESADPVAQQWGVGVGGGRSVSGRAAVCSRVRRREAEANTCNSGT